MTYTVKAVYLRRHTDDHSSDGYENQIERSIGWADLEWVDWITGLIKMSKHKFVLKLNKRIILTEDAEDENETADMSKIWETNKYNIVLCPNAQRNYF